jgi:hypothetical protein
MQSLSFIMVFYLLMIPQTSLSRGNWQSHKGLDDRLTHDVNGEECLHGCGDVAVAGHTTEKRAHVTSIQSRTKQTPVKKKKGGGIISIQQ